MNFVTFREDIDHAPLLKGLPNNQCQCPHWGYVIKGKMTDPSATARRSSRPASVLRATRSRPGAQRAGHRIPPVSPAEELRQTSEVIMKNMQAMQAG